MGLMTDDPRPIGISLQDAYAAIRSWYQANIDRLAADPDRGISAKAAKNYIASMPTAGDATRDEMIDAFRRVIAGNLEFAYHDADDKYKMAAYAWAACDAGGINPLKLE